MSTIFYRKEGRKYIPVSEYDDELMSAFPHGSHLIVCHTGTGRKSIRYKIDPAYAPMIAAGNIAIDAIAQVITEELSYKPTTAPITEEQREAWENMRKVWGDDLCRLECESIMKAIHAGIEKMANEANLLLENPALKLSYDNFILLSKLSKGE